MHRTALERTSGGQAHLGSNKSRSWPHTRASGQMLREHEETWTVTSAHPPPVVPSSSLPSHRTEIIPAS